MRKLWVKFLLWRLDRKRQGPKLHPTNRTTRRAAARRLAGHDGDRRAIYRALRERER